MSDGDETSGGTEATGYAEGEGQRIRSLDDLFGRLDKQQGQLDRLAELVSHVIPGSRTEAQQHTERRLDRPTRGADAATDMGEQVRRELDRREAAAAERTEREQLKAQVAKLSETPPKPPVPRRTKLLGWGSE